MTLKLTKMAKEKQEFEELLKTNISIENIVAGYTNRLLKKHYPDIDNFSKYLIAFKPKLAEAKKQKVLELYQYNVEKSKHTNANGNVHSINAKEILGITDKEYQKFIKEGFLIPSEYVEFKKWGKYLETPYYNYDNLIDIKKNHLHTFRLKIAGFSNEASKEEWSKFLSHVYKKFSVSYVNGKWLYFAMIYNNQSKPIYEKLNISISVKNFNKTDHYQQETTDKFLRELSKVHKKITNTIIEIEKIFFQYNITPDEIRFFNSIIDSESIARDVFFKKIDSTVNEILENRKIMFTKNLLDLENYHKSFPVARAINRDIQFIVGPTNSGKTYEALNSLMQSSSGVYLAPLRLMALEVFDKLNAAGVPCNLITGEEKIIVPNAMHTSSTIECLNITHCVDVAIIDEFQMVADTQRGWAWSQAILGVPAKKVFIIGNSTALNHSIKVLQLTNDTINVTKKTRLSKLLVLNKPLELEELHHGDALICFSRKSVLSYAASLKHLGQKVSIIYGSLPPEVRKKQAELFASGHTDILVSTDAIGMGLNLPIDRVIFSQLTKYDGNISRMLLSSEIKQIAGRAGRFTNDGFVGVLGKENSDYIKEIKPNLDFIDNDINTFQISPNEWHVKIIEDNLPVKSLVDVLQVFPSLCKSENYYGIQTSELISVTRTVDAMLDLPLIDKLKFIFTPIDMSAGSQVDRFQEILRLVFKKVPLKDKLDYRNHYKKIDLKKAEDENKIISIYNYLSKYTDIMLIDTTKERKLELDKFILKNITNIDFNHEIFERKNYDYYYHY